MNDSRPPKAADQLLNMKGPKMNARPVVRMGMALLLGLSVLSGCERPKETKVASDLPNAKELGYEVRRPPPGSESLRDFTVRTQGRYAYGIYLDDQKLGWLVWEWKLGNHQGKEAAVLVEQGQFAESFLGEKTVMQFQSRLVYELLEPGKIIFVEEQLVEDGTTTATTAVRDGDELVITTEIGDRTTQRRVPLPKDTVDQTRAMERWLAGPPEEGATFEIHEVYLDAEDVDVKTVYTYLDRRSVRWGGVPVEVSRVKAEVDGLVVDMEVLPDGTPVKGKIGPFDMRLEEEAVAKNLDVAVVDMLVVIPTDKNLGDPENVESLELEVRGLGDLAVPTSHRQKTRSGKDGSVVLELSRDHRATTPVRLTQEEREKYLSSTPSVQSDQDAILRRSKEIAGDQTDPVEVARRLNTWVYENLEGSYSANASTALHVLENLAGDCTEHAVLFVALARAAGVPAREVGGLMFAEGDRPAFVWHAWAEIHDGSHWVGVDPTLNQVYVDATHVKLHDGADDLTYVNVLGKLKIRVVDFK